MHSVCTVCTVCLTYGHVQCIYIDGDWIHDDEDQDEDEYRPMVKVVRSVYRSFWSHMKEDRGEDDYVKLDNPGILLELLLGGSMERGMRMWPEVEVGKVAAPFR